MNFKKCLKNLILVFASTVSILILAEVIVRLLIPPRIVGPSFTTYDRFYGKRLKKNFSAKRISKEFTMRFTTNALGFRGTKTDGILHRPIIFLGDSFTMGYGVNDLETFPALIQKKLGLPVINAGIGYNGNGQWLKFLRTEADKYNPRLIVLQFADNDFEENVQERLFELNNSGLKELVVAKPSAARVIQNTVESIPILSYSYLIGLVRQFLWMSTVITINPEQEKLTYRIVEEVLLLCKQKKRPIIALIVGLKGRRLEKLTKMLLQYDIKYIKVPFRQERPKLYYKIDGHWNAAGHAFVAESIIQQLKKTNLFN